MAQFLSLFILFCSITLSVGNRPFFPNSVILPVTKDPSTLQYVTQIYIGEPVQPIKLLVDLGSPFLWIDCLSSSPSSSLQHVQCGSISCSMAKAGSCEVGQKTCALRTENPVTGMATSGELTEETVAMELRDGFLKTGSVASINHLLFSCAPSFLLEGLASGVKGVLGLGNSRIALPSQLVNTLGFQRKFAICLSSATGFIVSGDSHYASLLGSDISKSMMYTPFTSNHGGSLEEYLINIKSIRINGKKLSASKLDESLTGGTKISTIVPYTTMESTLYSIFVEAYVKIATSMNMTKVVPVKPFKVCFSAEGVGATRAGPAVPTIDLVLQSEMVKWRIDGRNSMIKVSDEVMCLAFLDGGFGQKPSIIMGGYQLEDNLLSINLGTSVLGFSSSLLLMSETSCSDLSFNTMLMDSL